MRLRRTLKILFAAIFGTGIIVSTLLLFLIFYWGPKHDLKDPDEWTPATACMEAEKKRDMLLSSRQPDAYRTYAGLLVSCDCKNLDSARNYLQAAFNLDGDSQTFVERTFTFSLDCSRCRDEITFIKDFKGGLPAVMKATYLGRCYAELGQHQEAIGEYSMAIAEAEKNKELTGALGTLYCGRAWSEAQLGDQLHAVDDADRGKALGYNDYHQCR
jgi:tetratricopeptide (TPR) repeat protein